MTWLRYPAPPHRARRAEVFAEECGLPRIDIVDAVAQMQERTLSYVVALGSEGHDPQARWLREGHLEELRARIDWTYPNRGLFEP